VLGQAWPHCGPAAACSAVATRRGDCREYGEFFLSRGERCARIDRRTCFPAPPLCGRSLTHRFGWRKRSAERPRVARRTALERVAPAVRRLRRRRRQRRRAQHPDAERRCPEFVRCPRRIHRRCAPLPPARSRTRARDGGARGSGTRRRPWRRACCKGYGRVCGGVSNADTDRVATGRTGGAHLRSCTPARRGSTRGPFDRRVAARCLRMAAPGRRGPARCSQRPPPWRGARRRRMLQLLAQRTQHCCCCTSRTAACPAPEWRMHGPTTCFNHAALLRANRSWRSCARGHGGLSSSAVA
jgi:hypothetical protein